MTAIAEPMLPGAERSDRARGVYWACFALVVLPLAAWHLATLALIPYHTDELKTISNIRGSLGYLMTDRLLAGHQPLYYLLAWLWGAVSGHGFVATRLFPCLTGFVALGFVYAIARRLTDRWTALLAVALLLLNKHVFTVLHLARPYALQAALGVAAAYIVLTSEERPTWRRAGVLGGVSLALLLTHNSGMLAIAGMLVYLLARRRPQWRLAGGIAGAFVLFLPWLAYGMTWIDVGERLDWMNEGSLIAIPGEVLSFSINTELYNTFERGTLFAAATAAVWAAHVALLGYGFWRLGRAGWLLALLWLLPVAFGVVSAVVFDENAMVVARYFVIAFMVQAIALATAATRFPGVPGVPGVPGLPGLPGKLAPVAAIGLVLVAGGFYARAMRGPHPVYEARVAQYLNEEMPDTDLVYVLQNTRLMYALELYTDADVRLLTHVYGVAPSFDNNRYGVTPPTLGTVLDPLPHAGEDEVLLVLTEDDRRPVGETVHTPTAELLAAQAELIADFPHRYAFRIDDYTVYRLRRTPLPADAASPPYAKRITDE